MRADDRLGPPDDLGPSLHVIPVSMRDPELRQPTIFLRENWLNFRPDIARRVDEHSSPALSITEQVSVRLDNPRW